MKWIFILVLSVVYLKFNPIAGENTLKTDIIWNTWKSDFKKVYSTPQEEEKRKEIFTNNLDKIIEHNKRFEAGETSYKQTVYKFSDLTLDEVRKTTVGLRLGKESVAVRANITLPKLEFTEKVVEPRHKYEFSWTALGHVSPVKDQGYCASDYIFAVTAAIESQLSIKYSIHRDLSEQQVMDCDCDNYGCDGGDPYLLMEGYANDVGITNEWNYPYEEERQFCKQLRTIGTYKINGVTDYYLNNDESALRSLVKEYGPVVVGVYTSQNFHNYDGGIFTDDDCDYEQDHATLVVGYGRSEGKDYWLIKNSWGTWWGEDGYIRMERNNNNMCRIAEFGGVPIIHHKPRWYQGGD